MHDRPPQARTADASKTPASATGNVFRSLDAETGLTCVNLHQPSTEPKCLDYEVRFCCPERIENGTKLSYECQADTSPSHAWYLDYRDVPFAKSLKLECTNNG